MSTLDLPKPAIIAHRGASAWAPENTIAAFQLAIQQRADAIELDAKLSADGEVVVIHDQTVDRTTPFHGKVIDFSSLEFDQMDAGSHFDILYKDEHVPTLRKVFEVVGNSTFINVELTNYNTPFDNLCNKVAELVTEQSLNDRVFYSSFSIFALVKIQRLLPESTVGLLTRPGRLGSISKLLLKRVVPDSNLHPAMHEVNTALVEDTHAHHQKLFVYTVNREQDINRLFDLHVDGVFTDNPVLARKVLNEKFRIET